MMIVFLICYLSRIFYTLNKQSFIFDLRLFFQKKMLLTFSRKLNRLSRFWDYQWLIFRVFSEWWNVWRCLNSHGFFSWYLMQDSANSVHCQDDGTGRNYYSKVILFNGIINKNYTYKPGLIWIINAMLDTELLWIVS